MNDRETSFPLDGGRWPGEAGSDGGGALKASTVQGRPAKPAHPPGVVNRARRLRRTMPWGQEQLWQALRRLRLNIRREAPLGRFTVDFVQHTAKLVVEIDGYWHTVEGRPEREAERDRWIRSQGYEVVRISEAEVTADLEAVALRIGESIRSSLSAAPPPSDPAPRGHLPPSRGKEG